MKTSKMLVVCAAGSALWACNQPVPTTQASSAVSRDDAAVLVNGRPISRLSVENLEQEFAQRRGGEGVTKDKIIEELTKREVLRQEAENQGLLKDPSVAAKIDNATRMVLSQVAAENLVKKFVPTEDELKQEYAQRVGAMKSAEYKARHILVEDEKQALDAIRRLGKGEDFAALAKKISKDPGSKNSGGELGWFAPQQMVPPFSDAVVALKNGEITKAPVKTDFGWHVIQREDSREQAPPAFEAVKDQLTSFMQTEKLKTYIAELESKAKIERLVPPAAVTAPPADKKPDAPSVEAPPAPAPH
jgi:peptidyl-prolyl cis-trans isomerase C